MRHDDPQEPKATLSLRRQVWQGLKRAHRRRPASFYMLAVTPLVLFLGVDLLAHRDEPKRFAVGLILLMLFFGIVLVRAVMDIFDVSREHFRETSRTFRDTLGDEEFIEALTKRKARSDEEK